MMSKQRLALHISRTSCTFIVFIVCVLLSRVNSSTTTSFLDTNICSPGNTVTCPCRFTNKRLTVNCTYKGFNEVPPGFPSEVKVLLLKNNIITWLNAGNFAGLHSLETLHASDNRIKNIQAGTFDKLYSLRTLNLQNNLLTRIESSMFRNLPNLQTLDLSNNQISRVIGDAFVTLTNINQIAFTGNGLMCDCEIQKFKQWYEIMGGYNVGVLDAYCANKNNLPIQDVSDFGGCAGQSLFDQLVSCESCEVKKSDRLCEVPQASSVVCSSADHPVCYTQLAFTTTGLELNKGCETYLDCVQKARNVNSQCFGITNAVHCTFCCLGHNCNDDDIGGRTRTIMFDLSAQLYGVVDDNLLEAGSLLYTSTQTGIANILTNHTLGTYHVIVNSIARLGAGELTVSASIECTTLYEAHEKSIYVFIYNELHTTKKLYDQVVHSWGLENPTLCPAEQVASPKGTFSWPVADIGEMERVVCPSYAGNNVKYATRECLMGTNNAAEWSAMSVGDCLDYTAPQTTTITTTTTTTLATTTTTTVPPVNITASLITLSRQTATDDNANAQAEQLVEISESSETYTSTDVKLTVDKIEELINLDSTHFSIQRETDIAKTMSNFLDTPQTQLSIAEKDSNSPTRFLQTVQQLVDKAEANSFSAVNPNLALFSRKGITSSNFNGYTIRSNSQPGEKFSPTSVQVLEGAYNNSEQSFMVLPADLPQSLTPSQRAAISKITFAAFAEEKLFTAITGQLPPASDSVQVGDDSNFIRGPNSVIMAASIPNVDVNGLQTPVLQRFVHNEKNSKNPECVFWDESLQTTSKWANQGCYVYETVSNSHTTCACDHLTNFALLMDIYGTGGDLSEENKLAMSLISYIGCGISIFGLLLTLITYCAFKKLRTSNPSKILINLCIALIAVNAIFIVGQQQYTLDNAIGCKVVAVLLHYFLLSAMTWMAVEAFYMYLALVKIFNTYIRRFLLKCCLVGWGLPLVVVAVTLGINKTDNYGKQPGDICWLDAIPFYGAFLAPVLLVLILNTIAFVMVTRQLFGMSSRKITKSDKSSTVSRLRGAVGVVILLGLTWLFAIFAVRGTGGIIVQYLFTILNSLQGLFVFIFYCFLHKEARKNWARTCCDVTDEKGSTQTSKGYNSSSSPSSRNGTASSGDFSSDISRSTSQSDIAPQFSTQEHTRGRFPSYADSTV
ncbi:adhesion G-protein coupled receptor G6-like isoform X2 [Pecten maximus]|uniref:adhesion G-protein coupled receptor G6-like isoform X2 n=1 Tax=Pecten maximus TaxID=6579 RepID=UPI001458ED2A|nr:adhesion G-protein coupled receptor G6-like isoform X2 [Pecten maximus]